MATILPARPRTLPIAPEAPPARHDLPMDDTARPVDRYWRPVVAGWEITLRCDQACRHCGSRAGRERPDELTTDEALGVVRQLADFGVMEVALIGGEVYLREDWAMIARAVRDAGMQLTMVTGGRGVSPEIAARMRDAGVQSVSVSIDGLEPLHDELRGPGSHRAAMAALANLRAVGVPISTNTQITRPGLTQIEPLVDLLMDAGIHSWQMTLTMPMGRVADEPDLVLEPYQVLEAMPMLARIAVRAKARRVRLWPGNDIGYFGPYETLLRGTLPRGHLSSCGAGRAGLGIEANGSVKGCLSLPTDAYVGGNLRDQTLLDLWERTAPLRFTRDRTVGDLWGFCRTCYYAEECRGGCTGTAHVVFGRPGNNPFCHHRALELLRQGQRERLVQVQAASGRPFDHGTYESLVEDWPEDQLVRAREVASTGEGWLLGTAP